MIPLGFEQYLEAFLHSQSVQCSAVCFGTGLILFLFPKLRHANVLFVLLMTGAAFLYQAFIFKFLITSSLAYLGLVFIQKYSHEKHEDIKKNISFAYMTSLAVVYFTLDYTTTEKSFDRGFFYYLDMWLFLRLLTLVWEFGVGKVAFPRVRDYFTWISLPLTTYGPLLRYSEFESQIKNPTYVIPKLRFVVSAFLMVAAGIYLSELDRLITTQTIQVPNWFKPVVWFGISPWSWFLQIAGHYWLMESAALLMGLRISPSFNFPFGRENISEFWKNWNITATNAYRDLFFYNRWGFDQINIYLNTLILFGVVGLWHGLNLYWFLWGMIHGIGFCGYLFYKQNWAKNCHFSGTVFSLVSRVATYIFVCSSWILPSVILKHLF